MQSNYKIIVAGSRLMFQYGLVERVLNKVFRNHPLEKIEIVQCGAKGADALGKLYADRHKVKMTEFSANWDLHGKAAGIIRNSEMADYSDACIVFWDGISKGSKNMIETAKKKGLKVIIHYYLTNKTEIIH